MKVVLYFRIKEVRWTVGDDELRAVQARYPQVEFVRVTESPTWPPTNGVSVLISELAHLPRAARRSETTADTRLPWARLRRSGCL